MWLKVERCDMKLDVTQIYSQLPSLECKKLCYPVCGPIHVSKAEKRVVVNFLRNSGIPIREFKTFRTPEVRNHVLKKHDDSDGCLTCPYLTKERLCSIYPARPLICRLWGVVENLKCPHGCVPSRYLTVKEASRFVQGIEA